MICAGYFRVFLTNKSFLNPMILKYLSKDIDRWIDGQMDRQMDRWMDRQVYGWIDRWRDGQIARGIGGYIDGQIGIIHVNGELYIIF